MDINQSIKCRICEKNMISKDLALHSYICFKKLKWAKKLKKINTIMNNIDFQSIPKRFSNKNLNIMIKSYTKSNFHFGNLDKQYNVIYLY